MNKNFLNQQTEEDILESYGKLLNWGVRKFLKLTDDYIGAEDIRQEGRIVILKLMRNYDPSIGTLDGYIKSLFYKQLRRALNLEKKNVKSISVDEEYIQLKDLDQIKKQELMEKLNIIEQIATEKQLRKIQKYLSNKIPYSEIKNIVYKLKKKLKEEE